MYLVNIQYLVTWLCLYRYMNISLDAVVIYYNPFDIRVVSVLGFAQY